MASERSRAIEPGREWRSPRTGAIGRVIELDGRAVAEFVSPPGTGKAGGHLHRDFEQRFEVVDGRMRVRIGGEAQRTLATGEHVAVPRGVPHQDPWNEFDRPATWRISITPTTPFVRIFIATYGELLAAGKLNDQETFTFLQLMAVLRAGRADSWAEGVPIALQRPLIPAAAALARLRGIRPVAAA
jgi:uncharacterized RmlC-like cupin family protein